MEAAFKESYQDCQAADNRYPCSSLQCTQEINMRFAFYHDEIKQEPE